MQNSPMDIFQVAQHADDLPRARAFTSACSMPNQPALRSAWPGVLSGRCGPPAARVRRDERLIYLKVDDVRSDHRILRADGVAIVAEPYVIFRHPTTAWDRPAWRSGWPSSETRRATLLGLISHKRSGES